MQNFSIHIPTKIIFGEGLLNEFVKSSKILGKKALILIGGGTVEKLGYLQPVRDAFEKEGVSTVLFSGVEPNPQVRTINKAAQFAKNEKIDFIIAFGGGSVIDAAKGIAILLHEKTDDIWQYVLGSSKAGQYSGAFPVVAIPTTAATASEVTPHSVISNDEVNGKASLSNPLLRPVVSLLDPIYTKSLSATTTQDGAADIFSHVIENYLLGGNDSPIADRYSEMVMLTVLETLPKLLKDLQNIKLRGDLFWASDLALNGYQTAGRTPAPFVLHSMEHAASGFYPSLAHGRGLATLYPAYFRWLLEKGRAVDRMAKLALRLFGIENSNEQIAALNFIEKFENWLKENSLYQSFPDLGVMPEKYEAIADYTIEVYGKGKAIQVLGDFTKEDIIEIFYNTEK